MMGSNSNCFSLITLGIALNIKNLKIVYEFLLWCEIHIDSQILYNLKHQSRVESFLSSICLPRLNIVSFFSLLGAAKNLRTFWICMYLFCFFTTPPSPFKKTFSVSFFSCKPYVNISSSKNTAVSELFTSVLLGTQSRYYAKFIVQHSQKKSEPCHRFWFVPIAIENFI